MYLFFFYVNPWLIHVKQAPFNFMAAVMSAVILETKKIKSLFPLFALK